MMERLQTYLSWWSGLDKTAQARFLSDLRLNKIDSNKKAEIKALAKFYIPRGISWNCGSCVQDAHLLLIKLNISDMKNKTMEYALYPGTILHDPINKDFSLILMPPKLTEGLALYHLTFNARAAKYFVTVPKDIDKRIADYLAGMNDEMKSKALPSALESFKKYATKAEAKPKAPKAKKAAAEAEKEPDAPAEQEEA